MAARATAPTPTRLVSRLAAVEDEIARLEAQRERLIRIPLDDYPNQAIVVFEKKFDSTAKMSYTYVALKAGGYWYLTGDGLRHTWESLMDKLYGNVSSGGVVTVHWVSELTPAL